MQDLSSLAKGAAWVTSQEGGNMVHIPAGAMTAKGSPPATPVPSQETQSDPAVTWSGDVPLGTAPDRKVKGSFAPSSDKWRTVTDGG
jgi:hypothetical protein